MDDEIFLMFNRESAVSNDFDELFKVRGDFGELLSILCISCDSLKIYQFLNQKLGVAMGIVEGSDKSKE
jgi:hypothetical protein